MILDSLLSLVPIGAPLAITNASVASPNTIDLLGSGIGTAPHNIIGNATVFGEDAGVNGHPPKLVVNVGTAFLTGSAATLQVQVQASADAGSPTYAASSWKTIMETDALTAAQLTANTQIARFDYPPVSFPANLQPRYLRLNFLLATGTFTAGTISFAGVTVVRDDLANQFAAGNFTVA